MNTIVIVIDALRADAVGWMGRKADTTPNLDSLAEDSLVFERAFAQSNYTDVCLSSLFSGLPPREHGVRYHGASYTNQNLKSINQYGTRFLPEILSDNNVQTIGLDWMGRWHSWGYDYYGVGDEDNTDKSTDITEKIVDAGKRGARKLPEPLFAQLEDLYYKYGGIPDPRTDCEELTGLAIEKLDNSGDDTFQFIHYWDVHPPFLPPEEHMNFDYAGEEEPLSKYFSPDRKGRIGGEYPVYAAGKRQTVGQSKEAYDGALHWVDEQIGKLIDSLESSGEMDDTLLIITGDHGHNFGEHDIFSDNCSLYDTSIHVPLLVHHPKKDAQRVSGLVQHTDVAPTILDFFNIDVPDRIRGNKLPKTRESVFAEAVESRIQMIRTDRWKYIRPQKIEYLRNQYWYAGDGTPELYDLKEDPDEITDVSDKNPEVSAELKEELKSKLKRQDDRASEFTASNRRVSDDEIDSIQQNLQALGYVDSN